LILDKHVKYIFSTLPANTETDYAGNAKNRQTLSALNLFHLIKALGADVD
jgi:hypothetical protein